MKFIACKLRSVVCFWFFWNATSAELFLEYFSYGTWAVFYQFLSFHEILVEVDTHGVWTGQKLLEFTGGQKIRDPAMEASSS